MVRALVLGILEKVLPMGEFHVYDIKVNKRAATVEIFIDRHQGLGIEECTTLHRCFMKEAAGTELDNYSISLSTPGLSRKCVYPHDFIFYETRVFDFVMKNGDKITGTVSLIDGNNSGLLSVQSTPDSVIEVNWSDVKRAGFRLDF